MDTMALIKKVRNIELKTRFLTNEILAGGYHSAFKGRGMSFAEVRNYQYGDDIRTIDWNVTARTGEPHIKKFEEERELTVIIVVDASASMAFGSQISKKSDLMTELASVFAFSALSNNDKSSLILTTKDKTHYLPPAKGLKHTLRIIRDILFMQNVTDQYALTRSLNYLNHSQRKKAIVIVLSDFLSLEYVEALKQTGKKHDVVALKIYDPWEKNLPNVGLINTQGLTTEQRQWIDTHDERTRRDWHERFLASETLFNNVCISNSIDRISIATNQDYLLPLKKLFNTRTLKRK